MSALKAPPAHRGKKMTFFTPIRESVGGATMAPMKPEPMDGGGACIKGVKVNANRSKNMVLYPDAVLERATPLYEGAQVFYDHSEAGDFWGGGPRSTRSLAGYLENVKFGPGGHRADLCILPSEVDRGLAKNIAFAPGIMGLSHVVYCEMEDQADPNGYEVVKAIYEVESVDLVTKPATTRGMFEQVNPPSSKENTQMDPKDMLIESLKKQIEEKDKSYKALEEGAAKASAMSEGLKSSSESLKKALEAANARNAVLESEVRKTQIEGLLRDVPESVAKTLRASTEKLAVEDAKAIIESVKSSLQGGMPTPPPAPRSEARSESATTATGLIPAADMEKAFVS